MRGEHSTAQAGGRARCRGGRRRRGGRGERGVQLLEHRHRGVEPLGQLFVERLVSQRRHLRLILCILGDRVERPGGEIGGDRHDARRRDIRPLAKHLFGRLIQFAGFLEVVGQLKPLYRIAGGHPHRAIDHAGGKTQPVEDDLRLHFRAWLVVGLRRVERSVPDRVVAEQGIFGHNSGTGRCGRSRVRRLLVLGIAPAPAEPAGGERKNERRSEQQMAH